MNSYRVNIEHLDDIALINLRCEEAVATAIGATTNLRFPATPFVEQHISDLSIVRLSPDQWWIRTSLDNELRTWQRLKFTSRHRFAAVTIVSDHFQGFRISGPDSVAIMAQATSIDLDRLPPGVVTRGQFARLGATIYHRNQSQNTKQYSPPSYDIFVESSYSRYIETWFSAAVGDEVFE